MVHFVSFPGLGIGEMKLDPVAFNVFGKDIAWYGIIITFGIMLSFLYVYFRSSKIEGFTSDDVLDYAIYCVITGIIGARSYYVLTSLEKYHSFYDVIAIWNGGLAIYGAVIGGILAIIIVSKVKKRKITKALDMISPAVMIGQLIGRWGNFVNAEAHGGKTEGFLRMGIRNDLSDVTMFYHPTFLYESLWNLVGFILINALYKKKKFDGQVFLMYISWYGLGRFFIEGMRTDSLYVGNIRISQAVGIVSFVVGVVLLIVFSIKAKRKEEEENVSDS